MNKVTNSRISTLNILKYLTSNCTSDVTIYCKDGSVHGHKLVLASMSKMLLKEFQENIWDENISLLMPDFTVLQISKYLGDMLTSPNLKVHSELNFLLDHQDILLSTVKKEIYCDNEDVQKYLKKEYDDITTESYDMEFDFPEEKSHSEEGKVNTIKVLKDTKKKVKIKK